MSNKEGRDSFFLAMAAELRRELGWIAQLHPEEAGTTTRDDDRNGLGVNLCAATDIGPSSPRPHRASMSTMSPGFSSGTHGVAASIHRVGTFAKQAA
jgi:hypothetical protein